MEKSSFYRTLIAFGLVTLSSVTPPSYACNPYEGTNFNEIYTLDAKPLEDCILDGADPPEEWLTRGGFTAAPTQAGQRIVTSITPAHRPPIKYRDAGCNDYTPKEGGQGTKAGGRETEGATDACDRGDGTELTGIDIPDVGVPKVEQEEIDCVTNLLGSIGGLISGTGDVGDLTGPNSGIEASGSVRDGCATGSLGVCGLISGLGGSICTNTGNNNISTTQEGSPILSRGQPPRFVEVQNVPQYDLIRTDVTMPSTYSCPTGCVLEFGNGTEEQRLVAIPAGDYVVLDENGYVYTSKFQLKDRDGQPIQLLDRSESTPEYDAEGNFESFGDGGPFVSIKGNQGVIGIDEQVFIGDTIDGEGESTFAKPEIAANIPEGQEQATLYLETMLNEGAITAAEYEQLAQSNGLTAAGSYRPPNLVQADPRPAVNQNGNENATQQD
jgi:hypothetical protein